MKLINKILGIDSLNVRIYPKEESIGNISIGEGKIICKGDNGYYDSEVNIKDIQYVYIVVNAKGKSLLFIFDHHQNWLPTNYIGFSKVYEELSSKFGFNDNVFFDNVHKSTPVKMQVWRKTYNETYRILDNNYKDYELGFEIQSPDKEFVSWDETYDNMKQNENLFFDESPYGHKISKFKYPVRIGNVILNDFSSYFDNGRTDVPVLHFYTHCIDKSNSDKSYYELKKRFQMDFSEENQLFGYERNDQNSFSFKANGIIISLFYTYDSEYQFDGGYTSFSVKNEREYSDFLVDLDYENKIEVSDYLIINEKVGTSSDYKRNSNIKRRPETLLPNNNDKATIWIDNKNSKIGFADNSYCQVFDKSEIISLTIQNVLPAKGSGGSNLELNFKDKRRSYAIFSGTCHVFNPYCEKISKLTGLEIKMGPEYHDC